MAHANDSSDRALQPASAPESSALSNQFASTLGPNQPSDIKSSATGPSDPATGSLPNLTIVDRAQPSTTSRPDKPNPAATQPVDYTAPAAAPAIDSSGTNSTNGHGGALAVGSDLLSGAWNELTEHPLKVAADAAIGLGIGIAATAAAPGMLGLAAVAGAATAGYELYEHGAGWADAAKVVANPSGYSAAELASANDTLKGVGGGITDLVAGAAGMIVAPSAGSAADAIISGLTKSAVADDTAAAGAEAAAVAADTGAGTTAPAASVASVLNGSAKPWELPSTWNGPLPPQSTTAENEALDQAESLRYTGPGRVRPQVTDNGDGTLTGYINGRYITGRQRMP